MALTKTTTAALCLLAVCVHLLPLLAQAGKANDNEVLKDAKNASPARTYYSKDSDKLDGTEDDDWSRYDYDDLTTAETEPPTTIPTTTTSTTTTTTTTTPKPPPPRRLPRRRGGRRCKCLKRYTKEVDLMIEEKLRDFEHKYLRQFNGGSGDKIRNDASSASSRLQSIDRMLVKLTTDVAQTKQALSAMSDNMDLLRSGMEHNMGDVRQLNASFRELDLAVDNLTRFVSRVERMIPPGGGALLGTVVGTGHPVSGSRTQVDDAPNKQNYPRNCNEVYRQGGMQFQGDYYIMIKPDGVERPFKALCKMFNNSGWTVIQKRQDGSVDFFRNWEEYRQGFGSLTTEFWLGNDYIHYLSTQEPTMLRIEMSDWEGRTYHAVYDSFSIDNEKGLYRLHIGNYNTDSDSGDSLRSPWENHDGMPFSTKDRDNDGRYFDGCAEHFHGAWWFNNCFDSHLNGKYYHKGFHKNYLQRDGIQWNTIHMYSSLKSVLMMIKPAETAEQGGRKSKGKKDRGRSKGRKARGSRRDRKRM